MSIIILEDNIIQRKVLFDIVSYYINSENISTEEILLFSRPKELIETAKRSCTTRNLYFLDLKIKNDEVAGFVVAKQIRQIEPAAMICFVTTYGDLALLSYDYMTAAFAYVLKNQPKEIFIEKIYACITEYLSHVEEESDIFVLKTRFSNIIVPFRELLYITTTSPHKLLIKTSNKEMHTHGSLKQFENKDNRLIRCHQSFFINIENTKSIDKSNRHAILKDGTIIPISKSTNSKVQEVWSSFFKI